MPGERPPFLAAILDFDPDKKETMTAKGAPKDGLVFPLWPQGKVTHSRPTSAPFP